MTGIAGWAMASFTQPAETGAGHYQGASGLPLAAKISLVLFLLCSLLALAVAWVGQDIILRRFGETESELVLRNRQILQQAVQADVDKVGMITRDWSQWDQLYEFAVGEDPAFAADEINPEAMERIGLDVIQLLDPDDQLIAEEIRPGMPRPDGRLSTDFGVEIRQLLRESRKRSPSPQAGASGANAGSGKSDLAFSGWLNTSIGPLIIAAQPILRSDATGPSAGTLVMARRLDPAALSAGISVLPSRVFVHGSAYAPIAPELVSLAAQLEDKPDSAQLVLRDADMSDFHYFRDINGEPAFLLETRMPRTVLATARQTIHQLSIVLLAAGGLVFLLLLATIRTAVSRPLGALASHMAVMRKTGEFSMVPGADSGDEIGTLAQSFNELVMARQKVEGELRTLSVVAEHADEAIVLIGRDGSIDWVNPAYERSRQVRCAEVSGRRPNEVVKGRDDPAMYHDIWRMVQGGETWRGRMRTEVDDGKVLTEDVVVSPVRDSAGGPPSAYVMLLHDVSERLALETQTAQKRRLEAIEQLAAGVAHEINTPAHFVDGNVRFLGEAFKTLSGVLEKLEAEVLAAGDGKLSAATLSGLLAEAEAEYLQAEVPVAIRQTLEGVGRISGIVQSLKEMTDPAPDVVPVNLNTIIEGAVNAAGNEWTGISFGMQLDPQLPWVPCRPESINQVLNSILMNAAQAIVESGKDKAVPGRIMVSTSCAGRGVEINICDDGVGMTPAVMEKIFDPFFTTRPVGKGTGQGLSVAHNVIRKHGGRIAVDSEPGRGSRFRIYLPLAAEQASGGHEDAQLLRDQHRLAG